MNKEAYTSPQEKRLRNAYGMVTLTGIALIVMGSLNLKNSFDDSPEVNNNPAILQIDRETCQGEASYIPLFHWTINPDEVAEHFESITGLPDGTDALGIDWDRATNQFTVKCLDSTP